MKVVCEQEITDLGQLYFDLLDLSSMPKSEIESIYQGLVYKAEFGASIHNQAV